MEPLLILIVMPLVIGAVAEWTFHDTRNASIAATLGCALFVTVCLVLLDPGGTWNGLAAFLVLPLPIAFALTAVIVCYGRSQGRRRRRRHDA